MEIISWLLEVTGGEIRLALEQAVREAVFNSSSKLEGTMLMEIAERETSASFGREIGNIGFGV